MMSSYSLEGHCRTGFNRDNFDRDNCKLQLHTLHIICTWTVLSHTRRVFSIALPGGLLPGLAVARGCRTCPPPFLQRSCHAGPSG